ncbi:MAG TPA: hypothetical protein VME20_00690 [Acidimicrobiales bacterium]|nr:hypothetical protein [Acidimicrobiales bacterium]
MAGTLATAGAAASAGELPYVLTNIGISTSKMAVRPADIGVSADGNGYLSHLHWTKWGALTAQASGLQDDRTCWGPCWKWVERPVNVDLTAPIEADHRLLFSRMRVWGPGTKPEVFTMAEPQWWAPTTTMPSPTPTLAGAWWYVGHSAGGRAVDVVRLDLIDFPAGTLHGTWTETVAPKYQSVALNGTECLGCGGPAGTYWNSFSVTGSGTTKSFSLMVEDNSQMEFSGGLGTLPSGASKWYGCTPAGGAIMPGGYTTGDAADLFLVDGSSLIVFYRPAAYSGQTVGVGRPITCY